MVGTDKYITIWFELISVFTIWIEMKSVLQYGLS